MMFREMRRKRQQLGEGETLGILERGSHGVLALAGDGGYPYALPISYVYDRGKLYFHGAKKGHKLDAIARCSKASFCVVERDEVVPEEYTTYFRSVIAFGTITLLEGEEKLAAIEKLAEKYAPGFSGEHRAKAIAADWAPLEMFALSIEYATGKEAIELVKRREP